MWMFLKKRPPANLMTQHYYTIIFQVFFLVSLDENTHERQMKRKKRTSRHYY